MLNYHVSKSATVYFIVHQQQQQHLPLLSHGCIQQQQTKYYRKIRMWYILLFIKGKQQI